MLTSDDSRVWLTGEAIHIFNRDDINLVVDVQALDVLAIAFNDIDQVVRRGVFTEKNFAVVHLVLVKDLVHGLVRIIAKLQQATLK